MSAVDAAPLYPDTVVAVVDHRLGLLAVDIYHRSLDWDRFLDGNEPLAHLTGGRHTYEDLVVALDNVKPRIGAGVWSDHPDLRQVLADYAAGDHEAVVGALPVGAAR